ncbi:AsmA family protein [Shigella flexneri]
MTAKGRYNGQPLTGKGKIGGMLALRSEVRRFRCRRISAPVIPVWRSWQVNDPMNMGGVDLQLKFAGDSLGEFYELTGVLLPDTPPFETDGPLVAK